MSDQQPPPFRSAPLSRGAIKPPSSSRSGAPMPLRSPPPRPRSTPRPLITQSRAIQTRRTDDEQRQEPVPILPNDKIQQLFNENQTLKRQLKQTKRFSPNNVTDAMSYRYLHIDSTHLDHLQEGQFEYSVSLLEPIKNASHIELTSFSIANDMYNVVEDRNEFRMLFKRKPSSATTPLNDVYMLSVFITPGFYTHQELLSAIITQLTTASNGYTSTLDTTDDYYEFFPRVLAVGSSVFADQTTYGLKIKFTAETSGKTLIQMKAVTSPVADPLTYGMLAYPFEDLAENFHDSIMHRMGFTKYQVYFTEKTITDSTQVFLTVGSVNNSINLVYQKNIYQSLASSYALSNISLRPFTREFTNSSYEDLLSNKLAWETHSSLILTCDLVHDIQTTTHRYLTLGKTEFSDALAHLSIDVNRASWVHYVPQSYTHLHKVDNPLIRNFRIGLKNPHNNRHFKADEHKAFQVSFKIHTMDDESIPNREMFNSISTGMQNYQFRD